MNSVTTSLTLMSCSALMLVGCTIDRAVPFQGILADQATAWNRGDIDGFMAHYWKSEELTFSSDGHTRQGWAETKARYEQRYPTPERMGHLDFTEIETHTLGKNAALVLGRWNLTREPDPVGGNFSLVFQRINGKWVIIHDHTSTKETEPP